MNTRTTEAIVLRRYPYRGFDRRVVAYTRDLGKLDAVARGTQRLTSKLAGSLEPLRKIRLSIAHGPRNDQVIGAVVEAHYPSFTESLPRFGAASAVAELIDQLTKPYHKDERLFTLFVAALERLNDPTPLFRGFVDVVHLQILAALGYAPEFARCVISHEDAEEGVFDPAHGGFVALKHAREQSLPRMTRAERKRMGRILNSTAPLMENPGFAPELLRHFRQFVSTKLDHPLRSQEFLAAVLRGQ